MEEIIKSIKEAEEKAAEIKANATTRAAEISAHADKQSAQIAKNSDAALKTFREEKIKSAEVEAKKQYEKTIAEQSVSAKAYADGLIEKTDIQVSEIVRRISVGSR